MRKLIVLILLCYIIGFSGCGKEPADEEATVVKQANAQVEEESYDCSTFYITIPKDWMIHGSPGTNTLVGHTTNGKFNPGENTFWDLKVTTYINDKNPKEDFPKDMAKTVADRKHGTYVGETKLGDITLYEAEYRSGAFTQKQFFGISKVKEDGSNYKYYNIDFTLKNCPDDFYNNAIKIFDGIKFNFTFDF